MKRNCEPTFEVDKKDLDWLFEGVFGNDKQDVERQRHFGEAVVKDALTFFNSKYSHDDSLPKETRNILEPIAISMYLRGFNRAVEHYIIHEDIFNLESNEDTK